MEQETSSGGKPVSPPFSAWLKVMAKYAEVDEPSRLNVFLVQHGCQCTREGVAEWLSGSEPSYEKSRDIIKAFHLAFPDLEVWEHYRRFVKGEPFMQNEEMGSIQETLEQILQRSGLPPGLKD